MPDDSNAARSAVDQDMVWSHVLSNLRCSSVRSHSPQMDARTPLIAGMQMRRRAREALQICYDLDMATELVIFDCDGVLVDSERMEPLVLADALNWLGIDADAERLHAGNRGGALADLMAVVEQLHGEPLPTDYVQRYRAHQLEVLEGVSMIPGARRAVEAAGSKRCVASGGPMAKMEVTLGAADLWDFFAPHIFSCYEIDSHKPQPDIYLHACAVMGVAPGLCVAVEDSVNGVTAATSAGVPVIGLARDTQPAELLAAGAYRVADCMDEVAKWIYQARSEPTT